MTVVAGIAVGASVLLTSYFSYYLLGPHIDNWLHILTARDFRRFCDHSVGPARLQDTIEARIGPCQWSSRHDEFMWASVVQCRTATDERYSWEVSNLPPRPWLPPAVYVTPLTRASAELVPELLPPGLKDLRFVPIAHYAAGVIYDVAQPDQARARREQGFAKRLINRFLRGGPTTG